MFKFLLSLAIYFSFIFISYADHGPKKMWKKGIKPFFNLHETKMMGPFKIMFAKSVRSKGWKN